jgi:hypothetical protein
MMTPEQMQNTMQFIVENHANAMIRMDRFDAEMKELRAESSKTLRGLRELRELVHATTDHNNEVFKMLAEILASQAEILASQQIRPKYIEDKQS